MLDFYDLSEKVTKLYFSDLKFELKNDCACRLIAEGFPNTSHVSLLLYSSKNDHLNNFGHYFNPQEYLLDQSQNYSSNRYEQMFRYLSVYQYLFYCSEKNKVKEANFNDFLSFQFFDHRDVKSSKTFEQVRSMFIAKDSIENNNGYNLYKEYKTFIKTKDFYELDKQATPSGKYFTSLVDNNVKEEEKTHKYLFSTDIDSKNKKLIKIFRNDLGIDIKENTIYLAIPLFAKNRYIGLIRVLWHSNEAITSIQNFLNNHGENELEKIANIIALHIGNSYNLEDLKRISYDGWGKYFYDEENFYEEITKDPNNNPNIFGELCESFRRTINCRCCILRLGSKRSDYPFIKGWAGTIQNYIDTRFLSDHFKNKEISLEELFSKVNKAQINELAISIIGIQFKLNQQDLFDVEYLYVTDNNIVNHAPASKIIGRKKNQSLKEIFTFEVISDLFLIQLSEVVILKIPFIKNGYITFGNSRFRPFRSMDIDILYPQIKNFGSEIFIRQSTSLELRSSYLDSLAHELRKPLRLALLKSEQMISEIEKLMHSGFPISKVNEIKAAHENTKNWLPRQFKFLLMLMEEWLGIFQAENLFERGILDIGPAYKVYNICETVSLFVSMFRELGKQEQTIGIFKDWNRTLDIQARPNPMLFHALLFVLMNNAIKYSFSLNTRTEKVEGYDQNFEKRSKGHIFVKCFCTESHYGYTITNWGKTIPPEYNERMFNLYVQCPPDENFSDDADEKSMGIGLYYGNLYAHKMGASLSLTQNPITKETIAAVAWKRI